MDFLTFIPFLNYAPCPEDVSGAREKMWKDNHLGAVMKRKAVSFECLCYFLRILDIVSMFPIPYFGFIRNVSKIMNKFLNGPYRLLQS
jgi:hypothetical protein